MHVARLIYSAITSLDGFIEDPDGGFEWGAPDEEVAAFVNEQERSTGTYLYGRRMYEVMRYWETADEVPDQSQGDRDFTGIWKAAYKVVYSSTLAAPSSERTRVERALVPEDVQAMKASARADIAVGGSNLASQVFHAGLVDECRLYVVPIIVGGGRPALPRDVRLELELTAEQRFDGGVVFLQYRLATGA